jgi:hypothetical protein
LAVASALASIFSTLFSGLPPPIPLVLLPTDGALARMPALSGAELRFVDFAFFAGFFDDLLAVFFVVVFFAGVVRFAAFLAFFAFFGARVAFFARFFEADVLALRFDLPACLRPFFLAIFFLALATPNSFYCSNQIVGNDRQRSA